MKPVGELLPDSSRPSENDLKLHFDQLNFILACIVANLVNGHEIILLKTPTTAFKLCDLL